MRLATGLRQGELLRLEWNDVDADKGTVTVLISENTKRRIVHLPAPAVEALKVLRRNSMISRKPIFVDGTDEPADKSFLTFHWKKERTAATLSTFDGMTCDTAARRSSH